MAKKNTSVQLPGGISGLVKDAQNVTLKEETKQPSQTKFVNDSWSIFIEKAQEYKQKQNRIATIYIDEDLKKVLDRMRSTGEIKLSTTAIVSAIVDKFINEHTIQIKDMIYHENGII